MKNARFLKRSAALAVCLALIAVSVCFSEAAGDIRFDYASDAVTVECRGLQPETEYIFMAVRGNAADYAVTEDSIAHIDQFASSAQGNLSVTFIGDIEDELVFLISGELPGETVPYAVGTWKAEPSYTPAGLISIEDEAFAGTDIQYVILSASVTEIGERAFAGSSLKLVSIPASTAYIADDAFEGCDVVFVCEADSYAASYAAQHDIPVKQ